MGLICDLMIILEVVKVIVVKVKVKVKVVKVITAE